METNAAQPNAADNRAPIAAQTAPKAGENAKLARQAFKEGKRDEALELLRKGEKAKEAECLYMLSLMIRQGSMGFTQDFQKSLTYLEAAAAGGFPYALLDLGKIRLSGESGATVDYTIARQCFDRASKAGLGEAWERMGYMFRMGLGVTPDYTRAIYCFKQGSRYGFAPAMRELGQMLEAGEGVISNYAGAKQCYEQAVQRGDSDSMELLGALYAKGWGTERDKDKASELYLSLIHI